MIFKKGNIPWNKGKKGFQKSWCKGMTKENSLILKNISENLKGNTNYKNRNKIGKNINCEVCENKFYVMPCLEKQKKTCSKECFKIWKSKQAKELDYGKWMKGKINHISEEGKEKLRILGRKNGAIHMIEHNKKNGIWNKGIPHTEIHKKRLKEKRKYQVTPIKDSSIEVKIQNFLKELKIEFFTHQYIKIEHGYQCDILIPSINLVIECDGDYWHKYPVGREIDNIRTKELINKGFKVLRLWEHEIKTMNIDQFQIKLKGEDNAP